VDSSIFCDSTRVKDDERTGLTPLANDVEQPPA
jgi:hypothetical protein